MKLGFKTKHYELVYKWHAEQDGFTIVDGVDTDKLVKYMRSFTDAKNRNIWFDHKNNVFFSQAQYKDSLAGKDHHFLQDGKHFLSGHKFSWYPAYKRVYSFYNRQNKIEYNEEVIFEVPHNLKNNKDKSLLVVCGGPSVNSVQWENLEFDSIWACNHFYKNEKVKNKKLDLAVVHSGVVDIFNDKEFINYVNKNNPIISFEIEQGNVHDVYETTEKFCNLNNTLGVDIESSAEYKNPFTSPVETNFFHTRYRGQPGLGLRMVIYGICMGFKDIYVVGLDGRSKVETNGNLLHAFDGNKNIPNWYKKFGDDFQERQFIIFWDYIQELKQKYNFNIFNLGEDTEHNVLSRLFKDSFPLPENIRESLSNE